MSKFPSILLLTVYGMLIAGSVLLFAAGFWFAAAGIVGGSLVAWEEAWILMADSRGNEACGFEVKVPNYPVFGDKNQGWSSKASELE